MGALLLVHLHANINNPALNPAPDPSTTANVSRSPDPSPTSNQVHLHVALANTPASRRDGSHVPTVDASRKPSVAPRGELTLPSYRPSLNYTAHYLLLTAHYSLRTTLTKACALWWLLRLTPSGRHRGDTKASQQALLSKAVTQGDPVSPRVPTAAPACPNPNPSPNPHPSPNPSTRLSPTLALTLALTLAQPLPYRCDGSQW